MGWFSHRGAALPDSFDHRVATLADCLRFRKGSVWGWFFNSLVPVLLGTIVGWFSRGGLSPLLV